MTEEHISKAHSQTSFSVSDFPLSWLSCFFLMLIVNVSLTNPAHSTEQTSNSNVNLSFSGFGTLGVVRNTNDQLDFHRDFSMPANKSEYSFKPDSLLGLQLNAELSAKFDGVTQVVIKDRVSDDLIDRVELLFLRYRPNREWSFRMGRTSVDFYLLSEYRNVSYAYLWSRPIPEFYSLTSSIARIDGVDVAYTFVVGDGYWESKLAYGRAESVLDGGGYEFGIDLENLLVFTNTYTQDSWLIKLAVSNSKVSQVDFITDEFVSALDEIPPSIWPDAGRLADLMRGEGQRVSYFTLGAQYDANQWLFQSEVGYTDSNWGLLQSFYNGYVSLGYRINDITLFGVIAHIANSEDPAAIESSRLPQPSMGLEVLKDGILKELNSTRVKQTTYSLGVRWDLYPNTVLKLQWDHSHVAKNGTGLWTSSELIESDQKVNLFSLNVSFVFSL